MKGPSTSVAAVYARRSVATANSVSIDHQLEAGARAAAARGWALHPGNFVDNGVSAIKTRARERPGFRRLEEHLQEIDYLIIYKMDRLVRNAKDFHETLEFLKSHDVSLVSVEDNFDLTSGAGRALASVMATFAELEADYIRSRYVAARDYAIREQRLVGGTLPFGWQRGPNPKGPGYALEKDPERSPILAEMAERALRGDSLYSIKAWLETIGTPPPSAGTKMDSATGRWTYTTIERLLRNPRLAGMTPYQPGRSRHAPADDHAVLRDSDGLPIIDSSTALITLEQRTALLARLDNKDAPQARPRASRRKTSPFLAQAVHCGHCQRFMTRKTLGDRPALGCPVCHQAVSRAQLEEHLIKTLLETRGQVPSFRIIESTVSHSEEIAALEEAIKHLGSQMAAPGAERLALSQKMVEAGDRIEALRRAEGTTVSEWVVESRNLQQSWANAESDEQRRDLLLTHMSMIEVRRGKGGRYLDTERIKITWAPEPPDLVGTLFPGAKVVTPTSGERIQIDRMMLTVPVGPGKQHIWYE